MKILSRNGVLPVDYCAQMIGLYSGFMRPGAVGEGAKKTYRSGRKCLSHEMKASLQLSAYTIGLAKQCDPYIFDEKSIKPMHCDLICYGEGMSFTRHKDANKKLFTCIYFLNEGYEGGTLFFDEGQRFEKMPVGSAVIWRNTDDSHHWVEQVTRGQRYVLAHWLEEN